MKNILLTFLFSIITFASLAQNYVGVVTGNVKSTTKKYTFTIDASDRWYFTSSGVTPVYRWADFTGTGTSLATWNANGDFVRITNGSDGQFLSLASGVPTWVSGSAVSLGISGQVPFMNAGGTDFAYLDNLAFSYPMGQLLIQNDQTATTFFATPLVLKVQTTANMADGANVVLGFNLEDDTSGDLIFGGVRVARKSSDSESEMGLRIRKGGVITSGIDIESIGDWSGDMETNIKGFLDVDEDARILGELNIGSGGNLQFDQLADRFRMGVEGTGYATYNHLQLGRDDGTTPVSVLGTFDAPTVNTGQGDNNLFDMDQNVQTTDAVTFTTVNTGQGANELYDMDQNVQTTDAVTFATVNTGQGNNDLYDMDQNVLTTSSPTFATITLDGTEGDILSAANGRTLEFNSANNNFITASNAVGTLNFRTGGANTRMVIDATGLVGIGVAPVSPLHVYESTTATGATAGVTIEQASTGDAVQHFIADVNTWSIGLDNSDSDMFKIDRGTSLGADPAIEIGLSEEVTFNYMASFTGTGSTTAININANFGGGYAQEMHNDGNNGNRFGLKIWAGEDSGSGTLIQFGDGNGTDVGDITFSGTTTTYGTSSDARLKTNIRKSSISPTLLRGQLKDYKWIEDGKEASGVIAQELYKVFPMAVHAPDTGMWSVDYGKLTIPLLVTADNHEDRINELEKESAELKAMIAALEKRLKALENK